MEQTTDENEKKEGQNRRTSIRNSSSSSISPVPFPRSSVKVICFVDDSSISSSSSSSTQSRDQQLKPNGIREREKKTETA